nr:immunoglobulin heavy chain junction region [Macaca mulatta]MOX38950.1 immunoglobulin heavy chain junction region [Macaca mulatta]MOX39039.1 immunoglobulin heavy chain junction region [Macaca mulatta]MOX39080.1 immunoglobulin heavy chain junction region [Macaca mulatta]MOX39671.1 immunoglobulin heavy chain junction region [Macaca mulatta]
CVRRTLQLGHYFDFW